MIHSFSRAALLTAILFFVPGSAYASNKVSSPDVTAGKFEIEYRGGNDSDSEDSKDGNELHKFMANYGLTDRLRTEVKGILAENGRGYVWSSIEWSWRYQLLKGAEWMPKLSLQGNYEFALEARKPDKFETTILIAKDTGPLTHVANINFENELGAYARSGTNFNFSWKTKYRLVSYFDPGAELYMDFGKFGTKTSGPNRHHIGPVFSGIIVEGLKYEAGFLAGFTDDAPDGRFKWILTYEF